MQIFGISFFQFVSHFIMLAVQIFCLTSESISKWEDLCHPYLMKFSVAVAVNHPPPPPTEQQKQHMHL